jgi:hypothetical protein
VTSSVRFAGKPPATFRSSNLPASCMAVAGRNWEGLLDFGRVSVEERGEGLKFGGQTVSCISHGWSCALVFCLSRVWQPNLSAPLLQPTCFNKWSYRHSDPLDRR